MSDIDWRRKLADGLRIDLNELETVVEEMHAAYPDSRDSAMCLIEDWEGRIRAAIGMVDGDRGSCDSARDVLRCSKA